jgi:hypothetical protein
LPQQDSGAVVDVIASPAADHPGMSAAMVERSFIQRLIRTRADEAPSKRAMFGLVSVGTLMTTLTHRS